MIVKFIYFKQILLFLVIVLLEPTFSSNISPDSKRLYHDIVSGHGLYYGFTKLTEMGGNNFKTIVFNQEKSKLWVVEFYNSWCGHCHRFSPTWKALASDVYEWRDVVGIGAVDCANDANNQLCRDLEVMYYPLIRVFVPNSDEKSLGEEFKKGTVEEMRKNILMKLKSYQNSQENVGRVNLKPFSDSKLDSLTNGIPSGVRFVVLIFEPEDSEVGSMLALDFAKIKLVQLRLVSVNNEHLANAVGVEQGTNAAVVIWVNQKDVKHTILPTEEHTRLGLNKAVRQFLVDQGVNISLEMPASEPIVSQEVDIGDVMNIMQIEEEIKKKLHTTALSTIVFQLDLEGAIRYSLRIEVPQHKNITGDHLIALKNYMSVLDRYFPFGHQGKNFIKTLKKRCLDGKNEVSGNEFKQTVLQLETEFKPFLLKQGWIGCQGSKTFYRGYPCSLWTLFHTLTVHEVLQDRNTTDNTPDVIHAMAGYIKNFFSCSDCAAHFTEMAKTIGGNVTSQNDSVMWLWAAHNKVNNRLSGDETEDPEHKKIQFPSVEACPKCHTSDGSWNKSEIFEFLINMYSNIVYLQEDDLRSTTTTIAPSVAVKYDKNLRNQIYGDDQGYRDKGLDDNSKQSTWEFNIFDISLCVVLYVCSVAILILVCIKFVFKRSYRKKPYIHDILNKV